MLQYASFLTEFVSNERQYILLQPGGGSKGMSVQAYIHQPEDVPAGHEAHDKPFKVLEFIESSAQWTIGM